MTSSPMPPAGLNRGKNTEHLKAYPSFFAAPDCHSCCFPLFPQTSQLPPFNPDNKKSPCEKIFPVIPKKMRIFTSSKQ
jgi:hypothetical protein